MKNRMSGQAILYHSTSGLSILVRTPTKPGGSRLGTRRQPGREQGRMRRKLSLQDPIEQQHGTKTAAAALRADTRDCLLNLASIRTKLAPP